MLSLGEMFMIHDLKDQGLSIQAIAQRVGLDRKTVRKYLQQIMNIELSIFGS